MKQTMINLMAVCAVFATANAALLHKAESYLSPTALAATSDGAKLYVACATAERVAVFDIATGKLTRFIAVPESPLGLALSSDGTRLYVTCAAPSSTVCVIETATGKNLGAIPMGHTAMAPVLSPDGKTLYVCNRFNNNVAVIDLATKRERARIPVSREPVAAVITPDGKWLLVANHLPTGPADVDYVAAKVSVIDTLAGKVSSEITLPNGSTLLRDVRVSPDGKYACVTHLLARFHLPTTQLDRGWVETNALSLIDLAQMKLINTVLLDNVDSGAANPWAAAWTADGKKICVTHAGTHEVSVIDAPALLDKLAKMPAAPDPNKPIDYTVASRTAADVPNDLSFLVGLRQRVKLGNDKGPRAIALIGAKAYIADYFSDSLSLIDLDAQNLSAASIALTPKSAMSVARRGELLWNDASICFQGWLSCSSCHSSDARVDGLNWDLLNDGIGNPKNAKSMVLVFRTPPTTSLAVREDAMTSVRAGIRHILFTVQPEEVAAGIDAYLQSLQPIPSPYLEKGRLSASAQRGKKLFFDDTVACADCHKGPYYSNLKAYDVGTVGQYDKPTDKFDNPTLIEVWRSAPYLHDGSAATVGDVLTTHNRKDTHGKTSQLTPQQVNDLVAFVLSL